MNTQFEVLLFYKYVTISQPEKFLESHRQLCQRLGLTGRIIIAKEGINATVEGTKANTTKYIALLTQDKRFTNIDFKKSVGNGSAFPKLSVKLRDEIVSAHIPNKDLNPRKVTGKYLPVEMLHEWIHSGKEFYIVDMRNDYEQLSGYFEGSILSGFSNFRDLPSILPKLKSLKNKTLVPVCTGGIRCEKASGFLVLNGFKNVYQLEGGVVGYMEKYPNEDFKGKLYVFDQRILVGFNTDDSKHEIVGRCNRCKNPSENYVNCEYIGCHKHIIICLDCVKKADKPFCDQKCQDNYTKAKDSKKQQNYSNSTLSI